MGEIHRAKLHMLREFLVPVGAGACRRHQLLHDRLALALVARQRRGKIGFCLQRSGQRDRVLDRKPRSRADREMRRVQRVADQHPVAERPALVPDPGEVAPYRFVREQPVAVEGGGEYLLANGLRLLDGQVGETVTFPGCRIAFDQEGAHVGRIAVVMGVERAELGLDKALRQRLEAFGGAVPGELVRRPRYRGAELAFETPSQQGVQAIGANDQVVADQFVRGLDRGGVVRRDPDCGDALLQGVEQIEPADRGEADAVDLDAFATQVQGNVFPALHSRSDGLDRLGIVGAQEFERLFGEHHAKSPGGAGGILLEQVDMGVGVPLLPQIGEVEAAGASTDHGDTQRRRWSIIARQTTTGPPCTRVTAMRPGRPGNARCGPRRPVSRRKARGHLRRRPSATRTILRADASAAAPWSPARLRQRRESPWRRRLRRAPRCRRLH